MKDKQITNKTIAKSLWWKLSERMFSQGVNLFVQIILARILLPSDFGCLAIICAITNYAAIFVQSGLATALIQKKNLDEYDTSTMLSASLLIALIFYVVLFFFAPYIATVYGISEILWPLRVLALILFLNAINAVQTALLSRSMDFKVIFVRSALAVPISGVVGILMAYYGYGVWALVTHNLLNMLIMVLVMFIGTDVKFRLGFSISRAKSLYAFSGNILISNLVSGFGDTLRTMTIGKKYSTNNLAYYDKAYSYSQYVVFIIYSSIQSVMLPVLSRQQDDKTILLETTRKTVRMVSFVMFPVLIGAIFAAKPIVLLVLSEKWAPSIPFFMLFCFFRLTGCITSVDKQAYFAIGRSDLALYFEIGLLIANVIMLFTALNIGIMAIAIGATVVELLGNVALCIISRQTISYGLHERLSDLMIPLINSILMGVFLYGISMLGYGNAITLLLQFVCGVTVYLFFAKITRDRNLDMFLKILLIFKKK